MHRRPDQRSENLAAALTVEARRQGLARIDQVTLSADGTRAFALQRGSHTQMAHVQTAEAMQTSIVQSSATWARTPEGVGVAIPPPPEVQIPHQAPQAIGR